MSIDGLTKYTKNLGGRPAHYANPELLKERIEEYFTNCPNRRKMRCKGIETDIEVPYPTIAGLVLFLGFSDRASFYDYEKREGFSHIIKRARSFVENEYEILLQQGVSIAAFALKQFDWRDTHHIEDITKTKELFAQTVKCLMQFIPADKVEEARNSVREVFDEYDFK